MENTEFILKVKKYINEHLDESLEIEVIAGWAGYSVYHFARLFKKESGLAVQEYIRQRRLIRASKEILDGSRILDAALSCGYQSPSGFCRAFKKEFGFPPELLKVFGLQKNWSDNNKKGREMYMGHIFMTQTDEHMGKEELFEKLAAAVLENGRGCDMDGLKRGYNAACSIYQGMNRYSGEEYVTHPLHVALLLAEAEADEDTVIAGMLCDAFTKTSASIEDYAGDISEAAMGILKEISDQDRDIPDLTDNALLVKLAERLHNMRTIEYMDEEARKEKSRETIKIFVPACKKPGNEKLLAELNDIAMKYL